MDGDLRDQAFEAQGKTPEELKREQELDDLRALLKSGPGARFLARLVLDMCHLHATSFTGNSQTYLLEGERNIGLRVMADLREASPDFWPVLLAAN